MIDKSHCMMNMEDEEEYLDFYDFRKTYENVPGIVLEPKITEKPGKEEEEDDDDNESKGSWEDCDESFEVEESKLDNKTETSGLD